MTFNQTALGTDPSVYSPSIRQPISIIDAVDHKNLMLRQQVTRIQLTLSFQEIFVGIRYKNYGSKKYSDLTVKPTNYYSSSKAIHYLYTQLLLYYLVLCSHQIRQEACMN